MNLSQFRNLSSSALAEVATPMAATITGAPATFGLSPAQATAMTTTSAALTAANLQLIAARNAVLTAHNAQLAAHEAVLGTFTSSLKLSYADPSVSDGTLNSIGLDSRNTTRTPIIPQRPTGLEVVPSADGTVTATWNANGSKYGVIYELQAGSTDSTQWVSVANVTRRRVTLSGFAPGVTRWFRVRATKNGLSSEYSFIEGIYIPAPGTELQQAA